jgi:hypothetical protein
MGWWPVATVSYGPLLQWLLVVVRHRYFDTFSAPPSLGPNLHQRHGFWRGTPHSRTRLASGRGPSCRREGRWVRRDLLHHRLTTPLSDELHMR